MNLFLLLCELFSFVFWRKSTTSKNHFEINWPLAVKNNKRYSKKFDTSKSMCYQGHWYWRLKLAKILSLKSSFTAIWYFNQLKPQIYSTYRIAANSFRGNYSFLNLTLCTVTFAHSTYRDAETIQGRKLFKGGNYSRKYGT